MGIYTRQIQQRIQSDDDSFTRSFASLSSAVMGKKVLGDLDASVLAKNAIEAILTYYKLPLFEIPANILEFERQLEYMERKSRLARRRVALSRGWYKNASGAYLGVLADGSPAALLPGKTGYYYFDYQSGKNIAINAKTAANLNETAYCFYKPLPGKPLTIKDFLLYITGSFRPKDFAALGFMTLLTTLLGLLTPYITAQLFGNVLNLGKPPVLAAAGAFLVGAAVGGCLIGIMNTMTMTAIGIKAKLSVGAAVYMRILSLPASFFKDKSSGEVAARGEQAESLCELITGGLAASLFTVVFSLLYIGQILVYAPALVVPALINIMITAAFSLVLMAVSRRYMAAMLENRSKERGLAFSLFGGLQKIKLAGAEKRAFAKWAELYSVRAKLQYLPPTIIAFNGVFTLFILCAGTAVFYFSAANAGVGVAEYLAFNAAFGLTSGAFRQLTDTAQTLTKINTTLSNMKEILDATPEISEKKQVVQRLSGAVELTNVSFRYNEHMPFVLDNLSLKIKSGSYVAVVGVTGCGKSTLMRLMLGFETPVKGAVYFDGKDLAGLDLKSFRKAGVGVVLQNGSLFQGDIFSNIVISAPWLTQKEAWEAAEIAGLADDIRAMPMGMHTLISEGSGGVSGGQKQRLMIARAVACKPKILMLDEATSALDNITQKHVSESLAKLKCTRIVIAHRLSTIKDCDRIIFLDKGAIAEDGTYDDLMVKDGAFADLVRRQQV